jgi:hypothetical protein
VIVLPQSRPAIAPRNVRRLLPENTD